MYHSSLFQECTFDSQDISLGSSSYKLTGSALVECESSFISCCKSYYETKYCTKGITQALNSSFCPYLAWSPLPSAKERISRSCCESCLKGINDQEAQIDCSNKSPSTFNNSLDYNVYLDCCTRKLTKITSATLAAHEIEDAATDVAIDASINPSTSRRNLPQRARGAGDDLSRGATGSVPGSTNAIFRSPIFANDSTPCSRINKCAHFCIDTANGVPKHCACREGFVLGEDGGSCRSATTVYTAFRSSSSGHNIDPCIIPPAEKSSTANDNRLLEQQKSTSTGAARTIHTPVTVVEEHEDTVRRTYSSEVTKYESSSRGRPPYYASSHPSSSSSSSISNEPHQVTPTCATGYKWDRNVHSCVDIDECHDLVPPPCHRDTESCVNYEGGFYCRKVVHHVVAPEKSVAHSVSSHQTESTYRSPSSCSDGLRFDGLKGYCVDIDECSEGSDNCHSPSETCRNTFGNFTCDCNSGYRKGDSNVCVDIDECSDVHYTLCPRQESVCFNTPGSYKCLCKDGFRETPGSNSCSDIDECSQNPSICGSNSICVNTYGTYKCRCQHGFKMSSDGKTCQDIDECQSGLRLCIGICENVPGSFTCRCPTGFRLDPSRRICEDIDECHESNPCHGGETCLNTIGSVKCYSINCPSGYYLDANRSNRCVKRIINQSYDTQTQVLRYGNQPHYITYNHLTLACNLTDSSRSFYDFIFDSTTDEAYLYDLNVLDVRAPPGVRRVTKDDFILRRTGKSGASIHPSGLRPINGPQDVDLEFTVKTKTGETFYKSILTIYVAQYDGVNFTK